MDLGASFAIAERYETRRRDQEPSSRRGLVSCCIHRAMANRSNFRGQRRSRTSRQFLTQNISISVPSILTTARRVHLRSPATFSLGSLGAALATLFSEGTYGIRRTPVFGNRAASARCRTLPHAAAPRTHCSCRRADRRTRAGHLCRPGPARLALTSLGAPPDTAERSSLPPARNGPRRGEEEGCENAARATVAFGPRGRGAGRPARRGREEAEVRWRRVRASAADPAGTAAEAYPRAPWPTSRTTM